MNLFPTVLTEVYWRYYTCAEHSLMEFPQEFPLCPGKSNRRPLRGLHVAIPAEYLAKGNTVLVLVISFFDYSVLSCAFYFQNKSNRLPNM